VLRHEVDWKPIPAKVERLLRRCLERDPKLRLRDIGDYRWLLEDTPRETTPPQSRPGLVRWIVAAVALVALAIVVILLRPENPVARPFTSLNVDLGSNFTPNASMTAVLSPDGTKLLYRVRTSDGNYALALRSLDQNKETLLTATDIVGSPFFSPDGQWIGFLS